MPDVPYGDGVVARHLLAQTSGIPNPIPLKWVHLPEEHTSYDERARLASVLARYPRLKFVPGARYAYSNIAYWLLGKVIERVTRTAFQAYVGQNIFHRLGLSTDEIGEDIRRSFFSQQIDKRGRPVPMTLGNNAPREAGRVDPIWTSFSSVLS